MQVQGKPRVTCERRSLARRQSAKSIFVIMVSGVVGMTVTQPEAPGDSSVLAASSHLLQSSVMASLRRWVRFIFTILVRFSEFSLFEPSSSVFIGGEVGLLTDVDAQGFGQCWGRFLNSLGSFGHKGMRVFGWDTP